MALLLYIFTLIVILVHVMFVVLVKALGNQSRPLFEALQTWATGLTYLLTPITPSGAQAVNKSSPSISVLSQHL